MDKSFDELSDDFLNEGNKSNKNNDFGIPLNKDNMPNNIPPSIKNIIDTLMNSKRIDSDSEDDLNLGEPDEIETSEGEDGNTYEKKTWETDFGSITRISIGGNLPPDFNSDMLKEIFQKAMHGSGKPDNKKAELSLEDQLKIAVANEDYLKAAELRDEIAKKSEKNDSPENPANSSDTDKNFWDSI